MPDILVGKVDNFADRDRKVVALRDRNVRLKPYDVRVEDGDVFVVVSAQEKAQ